MSTEGFSFSADGKTLLKCNFSQLGTNIIVPDGCTEIADKVFAEAPVISVTLPDTVTKIGENLFSSCDTLQTVKLSANLTELKPFTFAGCTSLKSVTMSDKITSFPAGLFFGCSSLESIPFTSSINSLEVDVFRECENLKSVKIPEGVKEIKNGALVGCSKLEYISFPGSLEKIEDRSLARLSSLTSMSLSGDSEKFFIDEDSGCLYEMTDNGSVLIKCPVNQETVYLIENTCDCHIDAFEGCTSLAEVYASTDAPETLVNRLMELIPQIDINSYDESEMNTEASEERSSSSVDDILSQNDSSENSDDDSCPVSISLDDLKLAESKPVVDVNDILSQNSSSEETTSENKSDDQMDIDISEIINSQCIHNDDHAEGFRPISMDELEALMNTEPVDPLTQIQKNENGQTSEQIKETSETADEQTEITENIQTEETSEDKPKRGRGRPRKEKTEEETASENKPKRGRGRPRKEKTEEEITSENKPKRGRGRPRKNSVSEENLNSENTISENTENPDSLNTLETDFTYTEADEKDLNLSEKKSLLATASAKQTAPAQNTNTTDDSNEPRFLRAMKSVAHHQMVLEEKENEKESVYGEMKELIVFADGVAPSTDDFSSHLVKFSKDVAKKYGFTKIYFFEDLPLDNPEFMYGLKSFGNAKNILYACNKPCPEKISDDQKELLDATGIELPSDKLKNVKGTIAESGLDLPVKILVQDNYIEGLLYCAEKFRAEHGID